METENKPNENKNKSKMRIYEDQTRLQDFVEPEWMKILRELIESNSKINENQSMAENHSIRVKHG